jgi:hypothetical protein
MNLNAKTDLGTQDKDCSRHTQRVEHRLATETEGGPGSARRTDRGKPNRGISAKGERAQTESRPGAGERLSRGNEKPRRPSKKIDPSIEADLGRALRSKRRGLDSGGNS